MPRGAGNANRDVPLILATRMLGDVPITRGPVLMGMDGDQRLAFGKPMAVERRSADAILLPIVLGAKVPSTQQGAANAVRIRANGADSVYRLPFAYDANDTYIVVFQTGRGGYPLALDSFPNLIMSYSQTLTANGTDTVFTFTDVPGINRYFMIPSLKVNGFPQIAGVHFTYNEPIGLDTKLVATFVTPPTNGHAVVASSVFRASNVNARAAYSLASDGAGGSLLTFGTTSWTGDSSKPRHFVGLSAATLVNPDGRNGSFRVTVDGVEIDEDTTDGYFMTAPFFYMGVGDFRPTFFLLELYGAALAASNGKLVKVEFIPYAGLDMDVYKVPAAEIVDLTEGRGDIAGTYDINRTSAPTFAWASRAGQAAPNDSIEQEVLFRNINRTI